MSIAISATDLQITANGATTTRPLSSVTPVVLTGADSLSVAPTSLTDWSYAGSGAIEVTGSGMVPISATGIGRITAGGPATLTGPVQGTTWHVTAAGSGTVGGLVFSGFRKPRRWRLG